MDKDRSIISQSAGKDAAELCKVIFPDGTDPDTAYDVYQDLRLRIFNDALALAGAQSVVERFEGQEQAAAPASGRSYTRPSGGGGGGGNFIVGSLEVNSGKHKGKTLQQIADEDPAWLDWAATSLNNTFLKGKVIEFLNAA